MVLSWFLKRVKLALLGFFLSLLLRVVLHVVDRHGVGILVSRRDPVPCRRE